MKLEINAIEVDCIIGERADERCRLQRLLVDIQLEVSGKAAETDELADAVDYVAVAQAIRTKLVEAKCKLIEHAAYLSACVCTGFKGVETAEARVTKSGAVPGIGSAVAACRVKGKEECAQRKTWWPF